MSSETTNGCPAPKPITLVQRLAPVKGSVVTVFTPGFPDLTKTEGILKENTLQSFTVGRTQVFFATSFYVVLNTVPKRSQPYTVNGSAARQRYSRSTCSPKFIANAITRSNLQHNRGICEDALRQTVYQYRDQ